MSDRTIAVAFGSNLGDRRASILAAAADLALLLTNFRLSPLVETAPVGAGLEADPPFLNAVGVGESGLSARQLLDALRAIEAGHGRARSHPGAPRTLDLDLILAGGDVVDAPELQVPHPRFRDRLFVLEPLSQVAPGLIDPVTGLSVSELLQKKRAGA